jgi:hypothetical protein
MNLLHYCYTPIDGHFRRGGYYVGVVAVAYFRGPPLFLPLLQVEKANFLSDFGLLHLLQPLAKMAETFTQCGFPFVTTILFLLELLQSVTLLLQKTV